LERSELNKKTKKELILIICALGAKNNYLVHKSRNNDAMMKLFKRQLERLKERIDYMINHPWATENGGFNSRKN